MTILTPLSVLKRVSVLSECIVHYYAAYQAHVGLELNHLLAYRRWH